MNQESKDRPFGPNWAQAEKNRLHTLEIQFEEISDFHEKNRIFKLMEAIKVELQEHGYSTNSDSSEL